MRPWPHAPDNWLFSSGLYFVSAGTLHKAHLLRTPQRLSLVRDMLFDVAAEFGWELRAWAVLSNHYHLVARSPEDPATLGPMLAKLHGCAARHLNAQDGTPGRQVWYRFRSTPLTYERSLLARLHYTHYNPARHGVAGDARSYEWCSAAWLERSATPAFVKTIEGMKSDEIEDEF
jgi:putative transposase